MRILVTRPASQAISWVARLRDVGIAAMALPLLRIDAVDDIGPLMKAWLRIADRRLVVFVSPNAVERFFAAQPAGSPWPIGTIAACVGPGSAQALRERGVPLSAVIEPPPSSGQFDAEALWSVMSESGASWSGASVLIVRGEQGRDWLIDTLRHEGARVEVLTAYRTRPAVLNAEGLRLVDASLSAPREYVWLFSSSQAVAQLAALRPDAAWTASRAIATHPRIADTARATGFGEVRSCAPSFEAVRACIQSAPS